MKRAQWDVVVVGGGPCGTVVAETLAAAGWSSIIVEAGPVPTLPLARDPRAFASHTAQLLSVDAAKWRYNSSRPFEWLRVRAAGGRSLLWGGWCDPPEARTFSRSRGWPIGLDEIQPFVDEAARRLRIQRTRLHPRIAAAARALGWNIEPKLAARAVGGQRPIVALDWIKRAHLRGNSAVLRVLRDNHGAASGVEIAGRDPRMRRAIHARLVVLCASPVETARILCASDPNHLGAHDSPVGRGLVDHLLAGCMLVVDEPAADAGRSGAWALSPRRRSFVEISGPAPLSWLGDTQLAVLNVSRNDAAHMSRYLVHALGESSPDPDHNRVSFDTRQQDGLGRPIPVFHLTQSERDGRMARHLERLVRQVAEALPGQGKLFPLRSAFDPGGVGHEAGTCRMGTKHADSVTDTWGAVRGIPRLYIADASLMPTALDRHPTWTLLALSLRVAHGILDKAKRVEL